MGFFSDQPNSTSLAINFEDAYNTAKAIFGPNDPNNLSWQIDYTDIVLLGVQVRREGKRYTIFNQRRYRCENGYFPLAKMKEDWVNRLEASKTAAELSEPTQAERFKRVRQALHENGLSPQGKRTGDIRYEPLDSGILVTLKLPVDKIPAVAELIKKLN